jgi:hypothetical protein
MNLKAKRKGITTKTLNTRYGGNWKYNFNVGWWEDDKGRMIMAVGSMEENSNAPSVYYMYGDGKPKWLGTSIT